MPNTGDWSEIQITNGGNDPDKLKIKSALFGDGQQANSLIQHLWFGMAGRNTYPQVNAVLARLGIDVAPQSGDHHTHYHVDFRPPNRLVDIESSRNIESSTSALASPQLSATVLPVNLQGEEMLRALSAAALALALSSSPGAATPPPTIEPSEVNARNVGKCNIYDPNNPYGRSPLDPVGAIEMYVQSFQKSLLTDLKATDYSVKYVELPQHGTIKSIPKDGWLHDYYVPTEGYAGNDRYVAEVTVKGVKFRVAGYIRPSSDVMSDYDDICRRLGLPGAAWKISDASDGSINQTVVSMPASLLGALEDLQLKMDDLAGGALGNTVGEGSAAQIFLDATAAGHGWYIDPTPLDNADDYLPTSKWGQAANGSKWGQV